MCDEIKKLLDTTRQEFICKMVRVGAKGLYDGFRLGNTLDIVGGQLTIRLAEELAKAFVAKGMMPMPDDVKGMLNREADLAASDTYTGEAMKTDMDWINENLDAILQA